MGIDNLFDKIYCICMDSRKSHMEQFFKKMKIKEYEYIDIVLGKELEKIGTKKWGLPYCCP